jgi:hypothetical protein
VRWLACEDAGAITDVDTPADLQSVMPRLSTTQGTQR